MSIGQVAKRFCLTTYTLRYWERVGIIPPVSKDSSGHRDFSHRDLEWLLFAIYMRQAGVSVKSLHLYIHLLKQGPESQIERKHLLKRQSLQIKKRINTLRKFYKAINWKINHYNWLDKNRFKLFGQL